MEALRALSFVTTALGYVLLLPWYLYRGIVWACKATYRCAAAAQHWLWERCLGAAWRATCAPGGCTYVVKEACVDCCDACSARCRGGAERGDYGGGPPLIA